jgi:hypothetical protein
VGELPLVALGAQVWALAAHPDRLATCGGLAVLFALASWISYARCKKRGEDFAQSVYDLFLAGVGGKPPSDKT